MRDRDVTNDQTVRVTLSLPDETVAFARIEAAKAGKSMSRWIADQVTGWWEADQAKAEPARRLAGHRVSKLKTGAKP